MATVDEPPVEPPEGYFDVDPGGYDGPPIHSNGHGRGRPLPQDTQAEASLLGALLLSEQAREDTAGMVGPADFYKPAHGHIADAIGWLVGEHAPVDVVTVGARLSATGLLDTVGGAVAVVTLITECPATSNAVRYAEIVAEHARRRRQIATLSAALNAAQDGDTDRAMELAGEVRSSTEGPQSSWMPIDLTDVLDGTIEPTRPQLLARTDGELLLYYGKIHAFNAEPEAGKSWLALHACAQAMAQDVGVLYIDYEDDERDVTHRLVLMGVAPTVILEHFHYVRPSDPIDSTARAQLIALADTAMIGLCVIDGVTEMLHSNGWSVSGSSANDDAAAMFEAIPRPIAATEAAVLLIDHVVKDKENQGRWGIGAQHKMAGITGASYTVESVDPFGEGRVGRSKLIVTKDRPGMVRKYASGGKIVGMFTLASMSDGSSVTASIVPPIEDGSAGQFRPTSLMEQVSQCIEKLNLLGEHPVVNEIYRQVKGNRKNVLAALAQLVDEGYIESRQGPNRKVMHTSTVAYRQAEDPHSDRYIPLPEDDGEYHEV